MWVSNILWEVEKFAKNSSQQDKANQISKVVVDDFNFASQAEIHRYEMLNHYE